MKTSLVFQITLMIVLVVMVSSVEARKLATNNKLAPKSLTVNLIPYDSLQAPNEPRPKRPRCGRVSPRHLSHLSSPALLNKVLASSSDNTSSTVDAQLTSDDVGAEYLVKLAIGTPVVDFIAIANTGSDLIWLQCTACQTQQTCLPQSSPLFDPSASSTYQQIACNSPSCNQTGILTGCSTANTDPNKPCLYFQAYADNTNTTGILSTDTITFPSTDDSSDDPLISLPSSVFGCGIIQNGDVVNSQGIVGLGTGPQSLVSQLGASSFSYCLVPRTPAGATSKLKFRADGVMGPTADGIISTPLFPTNDSTSYRIMLDGVSVGNATFTVGEIVIIDSGTTLTWLETSVFNSIKDTIKSSIPLEPMSGADVDPLLCYQTEETLRIPDEVVFHFKGADVVLSPHNIFVQADDGIQCLAMAPTSGSLFLFENIAQINFEVTYLLQDKQISFAPKDCTTF